MHHDLFGHRERSGQVVYKTHHGTRYPVMTCADSYNETSVIFAAGVAQRIGVPLTPLASQGSTLGSLFEDKTRAFIRDGLDKFAHLHTRSLVVEAGGRGIARFAQFAHLDTIQALVQGDPQLEAALGGDYLVKPDILIHFAAESDQSLNASGAGLTAQTAARSPLREANSSLPLLHASVSCKWTMRRDRAQNTRLEALNLVRNRKGRLPHIAAVTMECDPEILASLCLGTGDIDCVYHATLDELIDTADGAASQHGGVWNQRRDTLRRMVDGSRLRDISDLPLDLAI